MILRRLPRASHPSESTPSRCFEQRTQEARILFQGHPLDLTRYEYLLLKAFLEHPGHVLSRAQLMDRVWSDAPDTLDSDGKDVGKDYSRWNDVYLTLSGKYGARSTRSDPDDDASSVMHVAAPIRDGESIIGVGDALLLRQAVGNLIGNAVEFSPVGSVVRVDVEYVGGTVHIRVIDENPGIPEYALNRIFERFYSLPRPDGAKSTGLGLPFVREIAHLHGGSVSVTNGRPRCVVACLQIPLA